MTAKQLSETSVSLYDEGADQMKNIECEDLYTASRLKNVLNAYNVAATDAPFSEIVKWSQKHTEIHLLFKYFSVANPIQSDNAAIIAFLIFLSLGQHATPLTVSTPNVIYHPLCVLNLTKRILDHKTPFDRTFTFDSVMRVDWADIRRDNVLPTR